MARYDQNYDIRDRSRLLRQILFPQNENSKITENAKQIFLANKPAPLLVSKFIGSYKQIHKYTYNYIEAEKKTQNNLCVRIKTKRKQCCIDIVDREEFQMGSLSHYINARANGYHDLPSFPEVQPDPTVRNVPTEHTPKISKKHVSINKKKSFYSDSDNTSSPDEGTCASTYHYCKCHEVVNIYHVTNALCFM